MCRVPAGIVVAGVTLTALGDARAQPTPLPELVVDRSSKPSDEELAERARDRAYSQLRAGLSLGTRSGTNLVGVGSRGRYRHASGAVELTAERFFDERLGFGLHFAFTPPLTTTAEDDLVFVRIELLVELGLARWDGVLPGSVVVGAGLGGDGLRDWFVDPIRGYPLGMARLRLWPGPEVPLQLTATSLPAAAGAGFDGTMHEHRFELATGYGLLQLGTRVSFTFLEGGEPARDFLQRELSGFVAIAVY